MPPLALGVALVASTACASSYWLATEVAATVKDPSRDLEIRSRVSEDA